MNKQTLLTSLSRWGNSRIIFLINCSLATVTVLILFAIVTQYVFNEIFFRDQERLEDIIGIEPRSADLGKILPGTTQEVKFILTNKSDHLIKVLGSKIACSCTQMNQMPDEFVPGQKTEFSIHFFPNPDANVFHESVKLFVDDPAIREITLDFHGEVHKLQSKFPLGSGS